MANLETLSGEELRSVVQGYNYLTNGQPTEAGGLSGLSDQALKTGLRPLTRLIDSNYAKPGARPSIQNMMNGAAPAPVGAQDRLKDIIGRVDYLTERHEIESLQSVLITAGYDVDISGSRLDQKIDETEAGYARQLGQQLAAGTTIDQMASTNLEIREQDAAEVAATQAQAAIKAQEQIVTNNAMEAALRYAGFPTQEGVDPKLTVVNNMYDLLNAKRSVFDTGAQLQADMKKSFMKQEDGSYLPTNEGITLVKQMTGSVMLPDQFRIDLESGNARQIELAQHYMVLKREMLIAENDPANTPLIEALGKVTPSGVLDPDSLAAANGLINTPLEMPKGIILENGKVNYGELITAASNGQLKLPLTPAEMAKYLKPEEIEMANTLPSSSFALNREQYIASVLIDSKEPGRYNAYLADVNGAHKGLNATAVDVEAIRAENVVADVTANQEQLKAVADLPSSMVEVTAAYALQNGGSISVFQIPMLTDKAAGGTMPLDKSLNKAEDMATVSGMDPDRLRDTIKLDPSSPDFAANMESVLKYGYVFENATAGVTMDTIPETVLAGFKDISQRQIAISTSGVDNQLETLGLPTDTLSRLKDRAVDGTLMITDIPGALLDTEDPQFVMRLDPNDPFTMLYRSNIYEGGPQSTGAQAVIDSGLINVNDSSQFAVAIQISLALKDNKLLEDIRNVPGNIAVTEAVAQGYLGSNAKPAVVTPVESFERPVTNDLGTPISFLDLKNQFSRPAAMPVDNDNTVADPAVTVDPKRVAPVQSNALVPT